MSNVLVEMYERGMSCKQIVEELELSYSASILRGMLRELGVEIRAANTYPGEVSCVSCSDGFVRNRFNQIFCKRCMPNRDWQRRYDKYKITKYDFDNMMVAQDGMCDLCKMPLPDELSKISIDHCHKQGHVRGLLHQRCNIALSYIEDSDMLTAGLAYIDRHRR